MNRKLRLLFLRAGACAAPLIFLWENAVAAPVLDERFTSIQEVAGTDPEFRFSYRIWPSTKVVSTEVEASGQPLPSKSTPFADNPENTSALLALVDASVGMPKSPRGNTVEANKQVIAEILAKARAQTSIGIFAYANDLAEISPLGTPAGEAKSKLSGLLADRMGSRLYKRAMEAIEKLASHPAKRKALLIFSTGKEEDSSIKPEDVIAAAKNAGVSVMAVGCPQSELDGANLRNLERIAAETLGFYDQIQIPPSGIVGPAKNPPGLADKILSSLDGGADIVAPLAGVPPDALVTVTLTTAEGTKLGKSLRRVPPPTPEPTPDPTPEATPEVSPSPTPAPAPPAAPSALEWIKANSLWFSVAAVALVALLAVIASLAARASRGPAQSPPAPPPSPEDTAAPSLAHAPEEKPGTVSKFAPPLPKPATLHPFLEEIGGAKARHELAGAAARIGRDADNDIVVSNDSVSSHHAKIQLEPDGAFRITDLGSNNGTFVNGAKATSSPLADGDVIDLGEVQFRFSLPK